MLEKLLSGSLKYVHGAEDIVVTGISDSNMLERHLTSTSVFVGVEFPDVYQVFYCQFFFSQSKILIHVKQHSEHYQTPP